MNNLVKLISAFGLIILLSPVVKADSIAGDSNLDKTCVEQMAGEIQVNCRTRMNLVNISTLTVPNIYFTDGSTQTTAAPTVYYGLQNSTQTAVAGQTTTTSSSFVATFLSVTITPTSASSRIKITVSSLGETPNNGSNLAVSIYRGTTNLGSTQGFTIAYSAASPGGQIDAPVHITYIDSPATTSATTYGARVLSNGGGSVAFGRNDTISTITAEEIR